MLPLSMNYDPFACRTFAWNMRYRVPPFNPHTPTNHPHPVTNMRHRVPPLLKPPLNATRAATTNTLPPPNHQNQTTHLHPIASMRYSVPQPLEPTNVLELQNLTRWLADFTQTDILRHFLNHTLPNAPAILSEAVIVALDTEWFQDQPQALTEIGIAELDWKHPNCNVYANAPGGHYAHAAEKLGGIEVQHYRVIEFAHLSNSFKGCGDPEGFQFGTTEYVGRFTVPDLLTATFQRYLPHGRFRPVIFLGHAIANDFAHLQNATGVDLMSYGTIVSILDTQTLALEAGISNGRGLQIGLKDLLKHFHLPPRDPRPCAALNEDLNLHTAGNDAAYTLIAAVLVALKPFIYPYGVFEHMGNPSPTCPVSHIMGVVQMVREASSARASRRPLLGMTVFCTRCEGRNHAAKQCMAVLKCDLCAKSPSQALRRLWRSHGTQRCWHAGRVLERLPGEMVKK